MTYARVVNGSRSRVSVRGHLLVAVHPAQDGVADGGQLAACSRLVLRLRHLGRRSARPRSRRRTRRIPGQRTRHALGPSDRRTRHATLRHPRRSRRPHRRTDDHHRRLHHRPRQALLPDRLRNRPTMSTFTLLLIMVGVSATSSATPPATKEALGSLEPEEDPGDLDLDRCECLWPTHYATSSTVRPMKTRAKAARTLAGRTRSSHTSSSSAPST